MENQKNFVRHVIQNNDILPIEEEMLEDIKKSIESKISAKIDSIEKRSTEVLYDSYFAISGKTPFIIKVNLSPDLPNFWKELAKNNFPFHPEIVYVSEENALNKFLCFKLPKGIFVSDISKYPFNQKFNLIAPFAKSLKKMHQFKLKNEDDTVKIFNALCPIEASMIYDKFPLAQFIGSLRSSFKNIYKSNLDHCGLAHFDLSPENIIFSENEFKFLNFEYAGTANIYIDIWMLKETMNASDESFLKVIDFYDLDKTILHSYREAADLFMFVYFNSKIIAEYMTFGVRNPIKLKYWINKSQICYPKVFDKLFVDEKLDNKIRKFYNLWK